MNQASATLSKPPVLWLLTLFVIYVILGCFGYGNDYDTYAMLSSGQDLWLTGKYHYSRQPGYIIPEVIIGGASLIGGHILTNLISALLGTATLYLFWNMIKNIFPETTATLIILLAGLNPYFVIASSSSMDYVYSLFFGLAGIIALSKQRLFTAALIFSIAASCRLSSLLIIGIVYLYFFYELYKDRNFKEMTRLFLSGCLLGVLTVLFFIPSFIAADYTFKFLSYGIGDWSLFGFLSRIIYKNIYLVGLLPFLFLAGTMLVSIFKNKIRLQFTPLLTTGLAIIIFMELLFFKIPVEISYLLPPFLVFIPVYVFVFQPGKTTLYILLGLTIAYGFIVNPDVLDRKYNEEKTEAVSAETGLFIRRGLVIDDVLNRKASEEFYSED